MKNTSQHHENSPISYSSNRVRGIYFLANNRIFDLAIAFLNSLRVHNPTIPLCLIPFDDDIRLLTEVSARYNFTIYDDDDIISRCDKIGQAICGRQCGQFRKLCAFAGPFDEFIYIDCDTILMGDPYFAYQFLEQNDFIFSHSNTLGLRRWVWKDSIFATKALTEPQIAFSANTGFFCSRRDALGVSNLEENLKSAVELASHMELMCAEQPYLNYVIVTSGKRYTSLLEMSKDYKEWLVPLERWAGRAMFSLHKDSVDHKSKNIFLYHWAGCWAASEFDKKVYNFIMRIGFKPRAPLLRIFMPRKHLWMKYRYMKYSGYADLQ